MTPLALGFLIGVALGLLLAAAIVARHPGRTRGRKRAGIYVLPSEPADLDITDLAPGPARPRS